MTQSFREEFNNARLEAASKFLGDIADNFKERINNAEIYRATTERAYASFKDASLQKVSRQELLKLEGFIKLKKVCADPSVDMALGPQAYELTDGDYQKAAVESLHVHVARPYADSGFLQAEKEWQKLEEEQQKRNRPGFLRRAFARIRERREAPAGPVIGYNEVFPRRPTARIVTEPLTPGPGIAEGP